MTMPLAFIYYEHLLPGSQLVNRLQDLGYRVHVVPQPGLLVEQAEREKPLVIVADLGPSIGESCAAITALKKHVPTQHIPVLAFTSNMTSEMQGAARLAGATLVAGADAILPQLPQLLEQVLQVE